MRISSISAVAALAVALVASPGRAQIAAENDPDQLVVTYQVAAGSQQLSGVAHQLEWTVAALAGGSARVVLRVPVEAFDSGRPELDAALRKALDADRYPVIVVEGIAQASALPVRFSGTIRLHGQAQPFSALLSIDRAGTQLAVSTSFAIDLESFGVERPSFDGAQVERKVQLEFRVLLSIHPQAVVSGGFVTPAAAPEP